MNASEIALLVICAVLIVLSVLAAVVSNIHEKKQRRNRLDAYHRKCDEYTLSRSLVLSELDSSEEFALFEHHPDFAPLCHICSMDDNSCGGHISDRMRSYIAQKIFYIKIPWGSNLKIPGWERYDLHIERKLSEAKTKPEIKTPLQAESILAAAVPKKFSTRSRVRDVVKKSSRKNDYEKGIYDICHLYVHTETHDLREKESQLKKALAAQDTLRIHAANPQSLLDKELEEQIDALS